MQVTFQVLGPIGARDSGGRPVLLRGPRHREVLARLLVARRRIVTVERLVDDLWTDPPPGAVSALRTFVAALRRALEPDRPPRSAARLLVTEGPGYALRADPDGVDAWRFNEVVSATAARPPNEVAARLDDALSWWRGPAYADVAEQAWARAERSRLEELRLYAVERRAGARLALGLAGEVVADLDAHTAEHPWREEAWVLLAHALYRTGRQGDALAVLRRARVLLAEQLGVDPGPGLRRAEADIRDQAEHLATVGGAVDQVWADTAAAYERTVASGARARLEATVGMLRTLAVSGGGGLRAAREHRAAVIVAAEERGDPELLARTIGGYDVPAVWTRSDDPAHAAGVVAAAERALRALPLNGHDGVRARLLATIAVESRGTGSARALAAAQEAEQLARRLDDPALLAFVLNGVFMQSFGRTGLALQRDRIGIELVDLSARHGLSTSEVLGHLLRVQARSAMNDFTAADHHAAAADRLGRRHELPLVEVFTGWYRALRFDVMSAGRLDEVEARYRGAAARLDGAGMPGLHPGLLPLALLGLRLRNDLPIIENDGTDWGPYEPWARPPVLLARGQPDAAAAALVTVPDPPQDLLAEALWCLVAHTAIAVDDRARMERAHAALAPAAQELAGAGSGLLTFGPVARQVDALSAALRVAEHRS